MEVPLSDRPSHGAFDVSMRMSKSIFCIVYDLMSNLAHEFLENVVLLGPTHVGREQLCTLPKVLSTLPPVRGMGIGNQHLMMYPFTLSVRQHVLTLLSSDAISKLMAEQVQCSTASGNLASTCHRLSSTTLRSDRPCKIA
jgi:hypothetical protein